MKIYIHVGYPKCGSTSLQVAMRDGCGVLYPRAGTQMPDAEHISLPLFIRGIDDWTRQFISDEWVQTQHKLMMQEVARADRPVFISSERLAALRPMEILTLKEIFVGYDVEIIIVIRDKERYLDSTWRHAVYRHDYALNYLTFLKKMEGFQLGSIAPMFKEHFLVHIFNLDDADFAEGIQGLTGADFTLGTANVGVPRRLAELLQEQHAMLGSKSFKEIFPMSVKSRMLFMMAHPERAVIGPFNVPLF